VTTSSWLTGWRLTVVRILALAAVIAITVFVFLVRDQIERFRSYGYVGIFLISILANATVILPAPGIAITFAMGAVFQPIPVAIAAGTGATLGELTGYLAGFSGQGLVEHGRLYERFKSWTVRYGGWSILVLAFIPNPFFDLAGMAAGALRMPLPKFLTWVWIGKFLKMLVFAYAGAASIDWLARLMG
jgi:membrane protein DedA with SNARE-associated domain